MTERKTSILKTAAILLLICAFAASALLTAVMSAGVFNNISALSKRGYESRVNMLYLRQKIHSFDSDGSFRIDAFGGNDALVFTELVDNTPYETWIYAEDGSLCEVTVKNRNDISRGAGQVICKLSALSVDFLGAGLYELSVKDADGETTSALVLLRCKQGEAA